jgi:hypothetical protein
VLDLYILGVLLIFFVLIGKFLPNKFGRGNISWHQARYIAV